MLRASSEQAAMVAGAVLVAIGLLGFVPDVTWPYHDLAFAGHGSRAQLLGTFQVSILLNLLHVLAGAAGLALARTPGGARRFLTGGGTALFLLWLLGIVKAGGWIPVDAADNWLHLALGVGLIGLGSVTARPASP